MATATWRRRGDGVVEIIRPNLWQRLGVRVQTCIVASVLVAVGVAGLVAHVQLGIPVLMVAGCFALAILIRRSGHERRAPAAPRVQRATLRSVR